VPRIQIPICDDLLQRLGLLFFLLIPYARLLPICVQHLPGFAHLGPAAPESGKGARALGSSELTAYVHSMTITLKSLTGVVPKEASERDRYSTVYRTLHGCGTWAPLHYQALGRSWGPCEKNMFVCSSGVKSTTR
jgi:hypothetical protein